MLGQMPKAMRDEDHGPPNTGIPQPLEEGKFGFGVHRRTRLVDDDELDLGI